MLTPFYEVFFTNATAATDGTVCNTFEKKWDIREVWINKYHITYMVEADLSDSIKASLPEDLIKDAGFSRLQMQNGSQPVSMIVVDNPKMTLGKLKKDGD